jgi:hypothetical protein
MVIGRAIRISIVLLGLLVSACASVPQQGYNKNANANVRRIAVHSPGFPEKAEVRTLGSVGSAFGLVGALVEEGRFAAARSEFAKTLEKGQLEPRQFFVEELTRQMQDAGFEVLPVATSPMEQKRSKWLAKPASADGADAHLDVFVPFYGYYAAGPTTEYRPTLQLRARLTAPGGAKVLFEDQIVYNTLGVGTKAITIEPDDRFRFKDQDALNAGPQASTDGLREAIRASVRQLVEQLT